MKDLLKVAEEIQSVLLFEEGGPKKGITEEELTKWIKEAGEEFDPKEDHFTQETTDALVELGINMDGFTVKDVEEEQTSDNLIDQVKAAGQMRDLKIICKDLDEFKPIRGQLTKYKTMKELREVMMEMLSEKVEEKPEPKAKVEKKPVVEKKESVKKEKAKPISVSRSDAVVQAIRTLCERGASIQEIMDAGDKIYVEAGGKSNPTATNVNRYAIHALIAFEVLRVDANGKHTLNK